MEETKSCPMCKKDVPFDSVKCCWCGSRIRLSKISNIPANLFIVFTLFTAILNLVAAEIGIVFLFLWLAGGLGLIAWDWVDLIKHKIDGAWCLWSIFFYPIYLWIRDAKTGSGWARSIFWIIYTAIMFISLICYFIILANGGSL